MQNNHSSNLSIGIFDSGIGGLTVTKETIKLLPEENIIYLGDTARVPYGTKSRNTVIKYAKSNSKFLLSKGIKLLVIACNTASAYSIDILKQNLNIPVIGVIEPGAHQAANITKKGKVGVIGTPSTIKSEAYDREIKKIDSKLQVYSKACPLFVPLAEEGWENEEIALLIAKKYLKSLKEKGIDVLILGCTHYPILKNVIHNVMGSEITLIDSAEETAKKILTKLDHYDLSNFNNYDQIREFYLTDDSDSFVSIADNFLGMEIKDLRVVDISVN